MFRYFVTSFVAIGLAGCGGGVQTEADWSKTEAKASITEFLKTTNLCENQAIRIKKLNVKDAGTYVPKWKNILAKYDFEYACKSDSKIVLSGTDAQVYMKRDGDVVKAFLPKKYLKQQQEMDRFLIENRGKI